MSHDPHSLRHQAQRSAVEADKAEFLAFTNGSTSVGAGIYDWRLAGVLDDFEPQENSGTEAWQKEDLKYDAAVGNTHEEIERRARIMGRAYPFELEGGTLTHVPHEGLIYEFLLLICNAQSLTKGEYAQLPRVFERVSARLVALFFGEDTQFIHTGWPRDPDVGILFKDAMKTVSERTGEWKWGPDEGLPDDPVQGDNGCDFVVWPKALDNRKIGQLFVLGQCACGNNWVTKWNDLNLKKLQKWFNPLSTVEPVRTFTTPYHVTDAILNEASGQAGVLFDRARLTLIAHKNRQWAARNDMNARMRNLIEFVKN